MGMTSSFYSRCCMGYVAKIFITVLVGLYVESTISQVIIEGRGHELVIHKANITAFPRKLLQSNDMKGTEKALHQQKNIIPMGSACSKDIAINQGSLDPLPSGIPLYGVEIINAQARGCGISNIHVRCGWFSSAIFINPQVFRRLSYDDCLVNNGEPLGPGQSIQFKYATTNSYPLSVSSVKCCS